MFNSNRSLARVLGGLLVGVVVVVLLIGWRMQRKDDVGAAAMQEIIATLEREIPNYEERERAYVSIVGRAHERVFDDHYTMGRRSRFDAGGYAEAMLEEMRRIADAEDRRMVRFQLSSLEIVPVE